MEEVVRKAVISSRTKSFPIIGCTPCRRSELTTDHCQLSSDACVSSRQYVGQDLPIVDFRFWISGSSDNTIRPLLRHWVVLLIRSAWRRCLWSFYCCLFSPNHFVRLHQHPLRHRYADLLRRPEVDHQLQLRRLLNRKISGLGAFQDLIHIGGGAAIEIDDQRTISD